MSSDFSDDDMPLASRSNGRLSSSKVSKADDRALDRSSGGAKARQPGVSVRNGPVVDAMDVDGPTMNGKRKSRSSITKIPNYKDESEDSDGEPLAKRQKSKHKPVDSDDSDDEPISRKKGRVLPPSVDETRIDSDSDDQPMGKKYAKIARRKAEVERAQVAEAKKIRASEAKGKKATPKRVKDESDDEPLAKSSAAKKSNGTTSASKRKSNGIKKEESDSDAPIARKAKKAKPAPSQATSKKGKAAAKANSEGPGNGEEETEQDEYEWWNAPKKEDDSIKWETLEHNGVMFPPEYQRLPPHIKLYYDGKALSLHKDAEEVATFFGSMLHSKHNVENPTFQKNFFADFKDVLKSTGGARDKNGNPVAIDKFALLDFTKIHEYYVAQSEAKKARPAAEKKAEREEKKVLEAPFMFCKWDGRKEQVGNFRVEPPGLFRGRGEHPKTGKVKLRVHPEQITINIGKGAKVPSPPAGHKWKAVQHDNKATWLAMWQENINGAYKYVMLSAKSAIKGQSDYNKFEKARELKKHIDRIRRDYTKDLKSEIMADRQRATAMYLIDKFALRAGNEKDAENEAETAGCCSLKYDHITLQPPNTVVFDFLGKDSIRFHDEVVVDTQVFKNLKLFKKAPKSSGDDIFDRLTTTQLNKHLSSYMQGLTAKVFRTYNASFTMSNELKKLKDDSRSIAEKVQLYNDCNRTVAILCNHKRTVGESHSTSMAKLDDKIKGLQYSRWRVKHMMLDVDPKQKKKKGAAYFELDEELTQEWVLEHQKSVVEEQRAAIRKKFEKENEKLAAEGKKPQPEKELKERLKAADEQAAKYKKENKTKKVEAEGKSPSMEKLEAAVEKFDQRIKEKKLERETKESNKEVALGTSKINYIDPRLTVVFAKKFNVPIEKFFSKTLREKFNWAIKSVDDENWEF